MALGNLFGGNSSTSISPTETKQNQLDTRGQVGLSVNDTDRSNIINAAGNSGVVLEDSRNNQIILTDQGAIEEAGETSRAALDIVQSIAAGSVVLADNVSKRSNDLFEDLSEKTTVSLDRVAEAIRTGKPASIIIEEKPKEEKRIGKGGAIALGSLLLLVGGGYAIAKRRKKK